MVLVLKVLVLLSAITVIYLGIQWNQPPPDGVVPPPHWWGLGASAMDDPTIHPFTINVKDEALQDLHHRLNMTRWKKDLTEDFNYGVKTSFLQNVQKYWLKGFDWNKQIEILQQWPHYRTQIEGLNIHYIHHTSKDSQGTIIPIILIHGWPSSVWEFHKLLPLLTTDTNGFTFHIVCPSIPGFGFSDAPKQRGLDQLATARIFASLMQRLGYKQYYVHGGDWGAAVGELMAMAYPSQVLGYHTTMLIAPMGPVFLAKIALGAVVPGLIMESWEAQRLYPISDLVLGMFRESGYFLLQATRPDTVGVALTDSPMGLAAYILEKFSVWTDRKNRDKPDGGLKEAFTLDELLTNVMIYWVTETICPSMRYYKEFVSLDRQWEKVPITVPTAVAFLPEDFIPTFPRSLMLDKAPNLVQYTRMPIGGHFAAMEIPHLMAEDIRKFVALTLSAEKKTLN